MLIRGKYILLERVRPQEGVVDVVTVVDDGDRRLAQYVDDSLVRLVDGSDQTVDHGFVIMKGVQRSLESHEIDEQPL